MRYLTDRKRAEGKGAAHTGTEHHWSMTVSAVGLALALPIWLVVFGRALGQDQAGVIATFSRPVPAILTALGVSGQVDTTADVWQLPDGHAGFDVTVTLAGLTSNPHAAAGPRDQHAGVALSDLSGTVHVTHQLMEVPELRASVHAASDDRVAGRLLLRARSEFASASQHRPGCRFRMTFRVSSASTPRSSWPSTRSTFLPTG